MIETIISVSLLALLCLGLDTREGFVDNASELACELKLTIWSVMIHISMDNVQSDLSN